MQRHARNLSVRSELKTLTRHFLHLIRDGQKDQATQSLRLLSRSIDQAAKRGILHRNTASRRQSRLARRLARLTPR